MHNLETTLNHAAKGFAIALEGVQKTVNFCKLIPLTDDAVIGAVTHPTDAVYGLTYTGDSGIVGKALKAGVAYPIFGTAVTMSTGNAMLIRH